MKASERREQLTQEALIAAKWIKSYATEDSVVQEIAMTVIDVICSHDATDNEKEMAASTLVEALMPEGN